MGFPEDGTGVDVKEELVAAIHRTCKKMSQ